MDQFWPDLQLPKAKIKMLWATAECDKIPKMGKIICFYVNTHVLKSEPGYFVTFNHRYCTQKAANMHFSIFRRTLFQHCFDKWNKT